MLESFERGYLIVEKAELMCWKCGGRWDAEVPIGKSLKKINCPGCKKTGFVFATGQRGVVSGK